VAPGPVWKPLIPSTMPPEKVEHFGVPWRSAVRLRLREFAGLQGRMLAAPKSSHRQGNARPQARGFEVEDRCAADLRAGAEFNQPRAEALPARGRNYGPPDFVPFKQKDLLPLAVLDAPAHLDPGPNGHGLSRKAIMQEIDDSLRRLGTDYVDLYQIHRWDYATPIEETLEALNDVVRAGKARYIGASSVYAWQFAQALALSERNGWARFVSMQNYVNLLYREEEREMLPLCTAEGIGVIPWSPLARGRLTRPWGTDTARADTDAFGKTLYKDDDAVDQQIVQLVADVATKRGVSRAQVATAWVLQKSVITAPIIGATKASHLDDAFAAVELTLTPEEVASLEAPYKPRAVQGFN
jgi:aryl-alcohol dehydrogenase-like predicted oxidoreductase